MMLSLDLFHDTAISSARSYTFRPVAHRGAFYTYTVSRPSHDLLGLLFRQQLSLLKGLPPLLFTFSPLLPSTFHLPSEALIINHLQQPVSIHTTACYLSSQGDQSSLLSRHHADHPGHQMRDLDRWSSAEGMGPGGAQPTKCSQLLHSESSRQAISPSLDARDALQQRALE